MEEDNPIEELASFILEMMQKTYKNLSPMSHIISLSLAISHIAHAIDISAHEIATSNISNDFMAQAAAKAGLPPTPTVRSLEWDMNLKPPLCPYCFNSEKVIDKSIMIEVDNIILGEFAAKAHCPNCNTKFYLNLTGESI